MKQHVCPTCSNVKPLPELNDDPQVNPKIKLDEWVQIVGHGPAMFRVMVIKNNTLELEKL